MGKFGMYGKRVAHPGKRDALVEVLKSGAEILSENSECQLYVVNTDNDDPDAVWVTEIWSSRDAHRHSLEDDQIKAVVRRGMPLVADLPHQVRLRPVSGKGLSDS